MICHKISERFIREQNFLCSNAFGISSKLKVRFAMLYYGVWFVLRCWNQGRVNLGDYLEIRVNTIMSVKERQWKVIWIPNLFLTAVLSLLRSASCKRLFEAYTAMRRNFIEFAGSVWFLALCWLIEAHCQQAFNEHVETLARSTNLFRDYHLPPHRLWRATCSKKHNGQHFQVHQVRLFCLQFFRIFRQFYASVTFQDGEKKRNVVLHGRRWH